MAFFRDSFFCKNFALLLVLNSIFIALAQFSNLPKLFDFHWWHCLFFREAMLFGTYFLAFCLVYYLPLGRGNAGRIIKKSFVALVSIVSVLLLLVNLFLVLNFGGTLNEHLLGIALQSDPNETKEFFGEYLNVKFFIFGIAILGILGLVYRYGDFAIRALIGGGERSNKSDLDKKRVKIFWAIFSALVIALILVHCIRIRPYNERESDVIYVALDSTKRAVNSILGAMREYEQINANFSEYIKNIAHEKAPSDRKIANIVLIIGESAQRNLMQIYGYELPNTPILSAIQTQNKGNVFVFSDVISSQISTFESLSQALTFANNDNPNKQWFEYLNLIDAMKLGGYKSVVISNQERFSLWSKATTTIFSRADELHWSEDSVAGKRLDTMGFDEAILPILDKVVESVDSAPKDNALFLALHLMGSHIGYSNRYPKAFERFSPRDITHAQNSRAKADLAQYANSILYTDFIVGEIIKRFAHKDSIVIYISDHANDVWDTGEGSVRSDSKITRFMVEVPFVVFVSDEFRTRHPQIYTRIATATNKPFMMDDLIHALIDIAGFKVDGFEVARSIFSDDFNANRARMVGKKASVDYDRDLKE